MGDDEEWSDFLGNVTTSHTKLSKQGEAIKLLKQQVDGMQTTILELKTEV
jgi:hypothetical protein